MPISQNSLDSELELRWRTWLDKGTRTDRLAEAPYLSLESLSSLQISPMRFARVSYCIA